jgi:DNA-damage-inducible protein D
MINAVSIVFFKDKKIRRIWHNEEWFYSIVDIVAILTESPNSRQYWRKIKDREFSFLELYPIWVQLKLPSSDGKLYETDCANTKCLFRIIQSIPSPRAEPFKLWLASVGYERLQEIGNPELAQLRAKKYYEIKGYSEEWVNKRLRSISVRNELTDEWKRRGITTEKEFSELTNELTNAVFGLSVSEYKKIKGLDKTSKNLRDYMSEWEILFNMLGEKASAEIARAKDIDGLEGNRTAVKKGGEIAFNAKKELEKETGKSIMTKAELNELDKKYEAHKKKYPNRTMTEKELNNLLNKK